MSDYTIKEIEAWLRRYGVPGWLYQHLTAEKLDQVMMPDDDEEGDETDDPKPDGIAEVASFVQSAYRGLYEA